MNIPGRKQSIWSWWYLLFIAVAVIALWVPLFNRVEPTLIGIPFFYWFQLATVVIGAAITALVYFVTND